MNGFEGYVGIRIWDGQTADNMLFGVLFVLLIIFAILYRVNYHSFVRMCNDLFSINTRESLFESPTGNDWIFRVFMRVQTLVLCSLGLYGAANYYGLIPSYTWQSTLYFLLVSLLIVLIFHIARSFIYWFTLHILALHNNYKLWKTGCNAILSIWGVTLYIPVVWLLLLNSYKGISIGVFILLYIFSRFAIIYKTIRIFYTKRDELLYFILYLCGQEILPLYFMFEGIRYLYNFIIEVSNLWH